MTPTKADHDAAAEYLYKLMSDARDGSQEESGWFPDYKVEQAFLAGIEHARKQRETDETAAYMIGFAKAREQCAEGVKELVEALEKIINRYTDGNVWADEVANHISQALAKHRAKSESAE